VGDTPPIPTLGDVEPAQPGQCPASGSRWCVPDRDGPQASRKVAAGQVRLHQSYGKHDATGVGLAKAAGEASAGPVSRKRGHEPVVQDVA
jgi:hypothetical protein